MAKGERGCRRSEAQWRALVRAYAGGGQSRRAFCAQHGIADASLRHWQRRLSGEAEDGGACGARGSWLVPVRVLEAVTEEGPGNSGVVLVAPGGVRIEVAAGFDAATLKRVLATLGTGA